MTNDELDDVRPPLDERDIDRVTRRRALRNRTRELMGTTRGLTFDRTDPQYGIPSYIGLIGEAAKSNVGIEEAAELAYWDYPFDAVPSGSDFTRYLKRLHTPEFGTAPMARHLPTGEYCRINKQFDTVNRNILDIANDVGLFDDSHTLGVDTYKIDYFGDGTDFTIGCPPKTANDVTEQFWFVIISILDNNARFIIGTRMLPKVSAIPEATDGLLSLVPEYIDIDRIFADAGLVSADLIRVLRKHAGPDWVMSAVDSGIVKQLHKATPEDRVGYVDRTLKNIEPSPNGIAYPYEKTTAPSAIEFTGRQLNADNPLAAVDKNSDLSRFTDTNGTADNTASPHLEATSIIPVRNAYDRLRSCPGVGDQSTHATYLTDLSPSEYAAGHLHAQYNDRWTIETGIDQLENRFRPLTTSKRADVRLYFAHVATVFHNWHALISRVPSPRWGVPMPNVTGADVLKAVEAVAFGED